VSPASDQLTYACAKRLSLLNRVWTYWYAQSWTCPAPMPVRSIGPPLRVGREGPALELEVAVGDLPQPLLVGQGRLTRGLVGRREAQAGGVHEREGRETGVRHGLVLLLGRIQEAVVVTREPLGREVDAELVAEAVRDPGLAQEDPLLAGPEGLARTERRRHRALLADPAGDADHRAGVVDRRLRDLVQDALGRVGTVERRARAEHQLDPGDVGGGRRVEVGDVRPERRNPGDPVVRQGEHRAGEDVVEATGHHVPLLQAGLDDVDARLALHVVHRAQGRLRLDLLGVDHRHRGRGVEQLLLLPRGRDGDRVEVERSRLQLHGELRALAGPDRDARLLEHLPAGQLEAYGVGALGEGPDHVGAARAGDAGRGHGPLGVDHLHPDGGEGGAGVRAPHGPGQRALLRRQVGRREEQHGEGEDERRAQTT